MADALGMRIEVDGGVRIVHLERAERRNAIDEDTAIALTEFFLAANLDPEVRALVLTGTGRDYCTGADVVSNPAAPALSPLDYRFGTDAFRALFKSLWELERPVVSAVNGTVAGAAGVLSAPFDRRLSTTPFAHAGYLGKLWEQLAFGVTLVLCPSPWSASEMARLARRELVTVAGDRQARLPGDRALRHDRVAEHLGDRAR